MELNLENGIKLCMSLPSFLFSFYLILSKDRRKVSNYTIVIFQLLLALNVGQTFLPEKIIDALGNFYVFIMMSAFLIPNHPLILPLKSTHSTPTQYRKNYLKSAS